MTLSLGFRLRGLPNQFLFAPLLNDFHFESSPGLVQITVIPLLSFLALDRDRRLLFNRMRLSRRGLWFPRHRKELQL